MKILQTQVDEKFIDTLNKWAEEISNRENSALFHIYVPYNIKEGWKEAEKVRKNLQAVFDNPKFIGCSATGSIIDSDLTGNKIVVSALISEYADTKIEVIPYYSKQGSLEAQKLIDYLQSIEDLRGIEIITSADYQHMEEMGKLIDILPEDIEIFGGVAVGDDKYPAYVFGDDSYSTNSSVFVAYSGKDLHLSATRIFGWNAIGYPLKVTRSEGPVLYEIDGKPAYDVYKHYLQIDKNNNFFYNALEFPLEVEMDEDMDGYIRHAKAVNDDGSILMSSIIPEGSNVRFTYGDPRRMLEHTGRAGKSISEFGPDVLLLFNCFGRMLFWSENANEEIKEMAQYAPTTGFSALGEIMRYNSITLLNNLSMVAVSLREGDSKKQRIIEAFKPTVAGYPITARLAIFINTITDELMEKNKQLNDMLYKSSHDYLTGLLNRGAIETMIYEAMDNPKIGPEDDWYLIMFDIDDFKRINDQYGHSEGDIVLYDIAKFMIPRIQGIENIDGGRWGGEEFMIFGYGFSDAKMKEVANGILVNASNPEHMRHPITLSIGLTKHRAGEMPKDVIDRVDALLYKAKNNGKNRVCTDL